MDELLAKQRAAESRCATIDRQLAGQVRQTTGDKIDLAAQRLLAGESGKTAPAAAELRGELARLIEERRVLARAIELQKSAIETQQNQASHEICQVAGPLHRARVKAMAVALIAVAEANQNEARLREELYLDGVRYTAFIRPMNITQLGDPLDWQSRIAKWFMEAFEYDFIGEGDVPAEWRRAWWERNGFKLSFLRKQEQPKPAPRQVSQAQLDGWANA